jgi:glucose-6-phosphate 1-epimerase
MTSVTGHPLTDQTTGRVAFLEGKGDLPMLEINTAWSTAEVYLHGAHVTHFKRKQEPPLLFMSQCSRFDDTHPIRGGVPVIFPWFGFREGLPQHGFARLTTWDLKEVAPAADGSVSVRFRLPECPESSTLTPFTAEYTVTVRDWLGLQLVVTNNSSQDPFRFENCLHSYFEVGDIAAVSLTGLKGIDFLDKAANFAKKTETSDSLRIGSEVDRVYVNTRGTIQIHDPRLGRRIIVEKEGSTATVVWNPWATKAQQMPDFGNEEYTRMVCVESGNIAPDDVTLGPGQSATLTVRIRSEALI